MFFDPRNFFSKFFGVLSSWYLWFNTEYVLLWSIEYLIPEKLTEYRLNFELSSMSFHNLTEYLQGRRFCRVSKFV